MNQITKSMIDHQGIGMKSQQLDHKVSKISSHSLYSKIETKMSTRAKKNYYWPSYQLPSLFPSRKWRQCIITMKKKNFHKRRKTVCKNTSKKKKLEAFSRKKKLVPSHHNLGEEWCHTVLLLLRYTRCFNCVL